MNTPTQTVLYLRESKDDELGIDRHRADLQALCHRQHWLVHQEFVDNDQSASPERRNTPRPAYTRMLAAARAGGIKRILCWHIDRLVRDNREAEDIIDLCRDRSIELWTRDGQTDLSTDSGRTPFRILTSVARGEIERKSERQKAAMVQRAGHGPAWWPTRPFGYRLKDESVLKARAKRKQVNGEIQTVVPKFTTALALPGNIILDQREAAAIREGYKSVIAGGSLKEIARQWNAKGILTPKGNEWDGMAVRQLLMSARNAALRTYRPRPAKGQKVDKSAMPEIVGPGDWPAIVSEQTWRTAFNVLTDPARLQPGAGFAAPRKYLLTGIATCSVCGGKLMCAIPNNTKGRRPVYCCKRKGCMKVRRSQADVDAWVVGHIIVALQRDLDVLTARQDIDTTELVARLKDIDAEKNKAAAMVPAKLITLGQLTVMNVDWDREIAEIDAQMRDADRVAVLDDFVGADDVAAMFHGLELVRQRAVVDLLCSIVIHPGQRPRAKFDETLVKVVPKTPA